MRALINGVGLLALCSCLTIACEGPEGPAGADGLNGLDGINGVDGADGADGADGDDGTDGEDGEDGQDGHDGQDLTDVPAAVDIEITSVDMATPAVIHFTVTDEDGEAFDRFDEFASIRWGIAELIPGADGDADMWQSYINDEEDTSSSTAGPDGTPVLASAVQATYERSGAVEYVGDGEYTYTFDLDLMAVTDPVEVTYEETYLHRVAGQITFSGSEGSVYYNPFLDWVPSGDAAPATRDMALTSSCNECHDPLAMHGGSRIAVEYCVVCHNPGTTDANSGNSVDMAEMTHKIHNAADYTIWGHYDSENAYEHVTYPQDITNCRKCHTADDADTPDGDNWKDRPTMQACGSCHTDIDWATGDGHTGGAATSNANCSLCHSADSIEGYHLTNMATPNNPELPDGVLDVQYEMVSAAVDSSNVLTAEFIITADGTAVDASDLPSDLTDAGRYPSFMLVYALGQDLTDAPADWNNLGNEDAQPETVSISTLNDDSAISYDSSTGISTFTLADAFPEGATLRTVALQGYFQQVVSDTTYSLHTPSAYVTVTGDDARRQVVDADKCANCHEYFEGHGGNRVYETMVCAGCHVPSLSSSGREDDLDATEANNGMKDMIHGIHAASFREEPYAFTRGGSHGGAYEFISEDQLDEYPDGDVVTFPGELSNCDSCHVSGGFALEAIPMDALVSSYEITDGVNASMEDVEAARASMPNDTDIVVSPAGAACGSCHDSMAAEAHMEQNGAAMFWTRGEYVDEAPFESCTICHGEGRDADVESVHGL